jgi:Tfp pilus assembly protein PilF
VRFPRSHGRKETPTANARKKPSRVASLLILFESGKKIFVAAISILGVLALAILFGLSQRPSIVVGKFSLSEEAKKAGYDELALSRQLANQIAEVIKAPSSRKDHRAIYSFDMEPTIDLEADNWSLKSLRQLVASLGTKRRYVVTGELLSLGSGKAKMIVRVEDSPDFASQDSLAEADTLIRTSAEYVVKSAEPYLFAAYALSKGRDEDALEQIRFCLANPPLEDDGWSYNLWGVYFLEKSRFVEAAAKFKQALSIDSSLGVAHYNLAQSLEGSGDVAAALTSYQRAAELWRAPEPITGHGNLLRRQRKPAEALPVFTAAVREFPKDVEARVGLALTLLALEQAEAALPQVQFARDLAGFDIHVERAYAAVVDSLGMRSQAAAAYQRIVDRDPTDESAKVRLTALTANANRK